MPKFWNFKNIDETNAELILYGDVSDSTWWGDEVTPKQFAEDLKKVGDVDNITVRINSGGGDVFAAQTIGNLLEENKANVTAKIDGLCASAATIIACHCNEVVASNDVTYMVHPVKVGIIGYKTKTDLQDYINAINTITENILSLYERKTGKSRDDVENWMNATSWWTGEQAKENGFIDKLINDEKQETVIENRNGFLFVNSVGMNIPFSNTPEFIQKKTNINPANSAADGNKNNKEGGNNNMPIKTVDEMRAAYPDLVNQVEQEASQRATLAERERIKDIEELTAPGQEDIASEAKFTKPASAAEYAIAAQKKAAKDAKNRLNDMILDSQKSGIEGIKPGESTDPDSENKDDDSFIEAIRTVNTRKKED